MRNEVCCVPLDQCSGRMLLVLERCRFACKVRIWASRQVEPGLKFRTGACSRRLSLTAPCSTAFAISLPSTLTSASVANTANPCLSECRDIGGKRFNANVASRSRVPSRKLLITCLDLLSPDNRPWAEANRARRRKTCHDHSMQLGSQWEEKARGLGWERARVGEPS